MRTFFDSSALAKRYLTESGTLLVLQLCSQAHEIMLAIIVVPELVSAFNRLRREGKLLEPDYLFVKSELAADAAAATIIELTPTVTSIAWSHSGYDSTMSPRPGVSQGNRNRCCGQCGKRRA